MLHADADKPQVAKDLAAPGAANSLFPKPPILDDSRGPEDPVELAETEAASGAVRLAAHEGPEQEVALAGFCPVSFVKRGGLLIQADPRLAFVQ